MPHKHTNTNTYTYTYIHTYIHTYIVTYIYTYIHTYIHKYTDTDTSTHQCRDPRTRTHTFVLIKGGQRTEGMRSDSTVYMHAHRQAHVRTKTPHISKPTV